MDPNQRQKQEQDQTDTANEPVDMDEGEFTDTGVLHVSKGEKDKPE